MGDEDIGVTFLWRGLEITATMRCDWPMEGSGHVEVRCAEPLPITTTGYRSIFTTFGVVEAAGGLETFVLASIEEKARSKDWQQIWANRRQLSLF